jgi:hypothetical protein
MLTVGDPLNIRENKQAATYTDTSRGGYCRIATVDDRLVGYLSIGATQPDSLSIKRLIDEGLPIHDIIKPLLKGNFDVREYLTKTKARTARNMLTRPLLASEQAVQWPDTDSYRAQPPIQKTPAARQTDEIGLQKQLQLTAREGTAYAKPGQDRQSNVLPVLTTGNEQLTGDLSFFFGDEINPFAGNLPTFNNEESRKKPTNPYNVPIPPRLPVTNKTTTRNLWEYAQEI